MKRILLGVVGVALGLLTAVRAVDAAATRAEKCAAAELKAAGTKAAAKLRCHEKALTQGKAVTSACFVYCGQSIHPNVHVGQQDFQAGRDAGESEARRDVRGGGRLFLFPDPLGLHNPATAPLAEEGEPAAHG